jgi:hypothetical protein
VRRDGSENGSRGIAVMPVVRNIAGAALYCGVLMRTAAGAVLYCGTVLTAGAAL